MNGTTTQAGAKLLALAHRPSGAKALLPALTLTAWKLHGASELDVAPNAIVTMPPDGWASEYWLGVAADLAAGPTDLETARLKMTAHEFAAYEAGWYAAKDAADARAAKAAWEIANEPTTEDRAAAAGGSTVAQAKIDAWNARAA